MMLPRIFRFPYSFRAAVAAACLLRLALLCAIAEDAKQVSEPVTKDGLSLTISLDKKVYRVGEEIKLRFELKNESEKDLFVSDGFLAPEYHEVGPGRHFEVRVTTMGDCSADSEEITVTIHIL